MEKPNEKKAELAGWKIASCLYDVYSAAATEYIAFMIPKDRVSSV
jgi:hypothetical protein